MESEVEYYTRLDRDAQNFKVEFAKKPWFDYWHTHVDWDGTGNKNAEARQRHLAALFVVFERVQEQAKSHLKEHQTWCWIGDNSAEDAVYLHTPNPNSENYPLNFDFVNWVGAAPDMLAAHFDSETMKIGVSRDSKDTAYIIVPRNLSRK